MDHTVFCACLLAVSTITSGQNNVDITPREVLSEINRIHKDFPNTMVKPILNELEKKPSLMTDIKNKNLEVRAAHGTNSEITLNSITMSSGTGSMQISHTANSEFQMKPQTSNGEYFPQPERVQNPELSNQNKIYLVNVPSETSQRKEIVGEVHQPYSAPEVQLVSAAQDDNQQILRPQTIKYYETANQPRFVNSISRESGYIKPQVVQRSIKDTFPLTDQQPHLVPQPVSVNLIKYPRRDVLLRQAAQVHNQQILRPQTILYDKTANQPRLVNSIASASGYIIPQVVQRSMKGTITLMDQQPHLLPQPISVNVIKNPRRVLFRQAAQDDDQQILRPQTILHAKAANQPRLVTSISSASGYIKPQVVQRSMKGTFTLTNPQLRLVQKRVNVNSITNPGRVVLLRRLIQTRRNGIARYQRNSIPVFSRPLLPGMGPVISNPVPMPLTPIMPLKVPAPVPMIPVGMAVSQCCAQKRIRIF